VLSVEFKLNLLAPARGDRIVAEGSVVKPGRTLAIARVDVHAEHGGHRALIAIMQQTLMVMHGKPDAPHGG
jgi:acyl-coenzyme A thioesterase PaaI-like protein